MLFLTTTNYMNECLNCNLEMEIEKGTFTHTIFNKEITLENVPYFKCSKCGEINYVDARQVESKLKEAYRNNQTIYSYE